MNEWEYACSVNVIGMLECMIYLFIYQASKGAFNTLRYCYTLHKTDFSNFFCVFTVLSTISRTSGCAEKVGHPKLAEV